MSVFPGFRHLWVRYVRGVRLDRHCALSFVGKGDPRVRPRATLLEEPLTLDVARVPMIYLCGVALGTYAQNLHVAMAPEVGATFEVETYNGYVVRGSGARLLPIPPLPEGWNGLGPKFTTCRNFRAAVAYRDLVADGARSDLAPVIQIVERRRS